MTLLQAIVSGVRSIMRSPVDSRLAVRWRSEEDSDRARFQHRHTAQQLQVLRGKLEEETNAFFADTNGHPSTPEQWAWYESIRRREAMIG